jgi:hypothetical protein
MILKIVFEKVYDKVKWDFLETVMKGKGFPTQWINWVTQIVRGGESLCRGKWRARELFQNLARAQAGGPSVSPCL